ncbi:hypothetical protein ACQ4PT_066798 [Festuca glaucescens]
MHRARQQDRRARSFQGENNEPKKVRCAADLRHRAARGILWYHDYDAGAQEIPQDYQCKDKFLVQSVVVQEGITNRDIVPEMFSRAPDRVVEEFKLRVVYIPANPPHRCLRRMRKRLRIRR